MCFAVVAVYPVPTAHRCLSGFDENMVGDWLIEAYNAGYWDVNTSDGRNIQNMIDDGDIKSAADVPPADWPTVGGQWYAEKEGADAMYEKLWNDMEYSDRISICGADQWFGSRTSFEDEFGDFLPYCTDPCGCDSEESSFTEATNWGFMVAIMVLVVLFLIVTIAVVFKRKGRFIGSIPYCNAVSDSGKKRIESLAKCTNYIPRKTQRLFKAIFNWLGQQIYTKPICFIMIGVLCVAASTGCGILYYSANCTDGSCAESRVNYLWIPRNSAVWTQFTTMMGRFGSYPSFLSMLLTAKEEESNLSPSMMDIAFEIENTINNITLYNHDARDYQYGDLCTRSVPNQSYCDSSDDSFFGIFFENNASLWSEVNSTLDTINTPYAPTKYFVGGLEYDEVFKSRIISAQSLRVTYWLMGSKDQQVTFQKLCFMNSCYYSFT